MCIRDRYSRGNVQKREERHGSGSLSDVYKRQIMGAMGKFMLVFAPTQLPLAIIEGIITVLIIMGLETYAKPELRTIGFLKEAK